MADTSTMILNLLKPLIAVEFKSMQGFEKTTKTYHLSLDTPVLVDIEAVTGFAKRNRPATAVYIWIGGQRWRYNGKRWSNG